MKKNLSRGFAIAIVILFGSSNNLHAQFIKKLKKQLKETVEQTTQQKAVEKTTNSTNKVIDKASNATDTLVSRIGHKKDAADENTSKEDNNNTSANNNNTTSASGNNDVAGQNANTGQNNNASPGKSAPSIQTYQNYDFVPGDTILFADDFAEDQDGEFPSHWNLTAGQAVVNNITGSQVFCLTEGNYCRVYPLMKKETYLTDPFTIEFDYFPNGSAYGPVVFLNCIKDGSKDEVQVQYQERGGVGTSYFPHDFSSSYPNEDDASFFNQWHHCAMIYKNNQLKCYVDQNRILVIPNTGILPYAFGFGGIGDATNPIIITNVRVASGGNMNMIGKKFTEAKIVTHGINFDVDKATIKPESMGTLNMINGVLKANPDLKFEIDGHTDNTGSSEHNLTLSQERADAVKAQLVSMGIDASRLTTKGFGDTKPIGDNNSPEGKANNRRVEFVKM